MCMREKGIRRLEREQDSLLTLSQVCMCHSIEMLVCVLSHSSIDKLEREMEEILFVV